MLFNTIDFAIFFPIVFFLYWFITNKNLKLQNSLIVLAGFIFYGWWDYRFLFLLLFSSLVDYFVGFFLLNQKSPVKRKILLLISIIVNLGILGFFKYHNFFVENFIVAFSLIGYPIRGYSLNIILPLGISFYTFQSLSYSIDVYKRKFKPTKDLIAFLAYISFFPQLVAGPIERATQLLPQIYTKRTFDYTKAVDGLRQILWGLFKKVVIADNCAFFANKIFENSSNYTGSTLVLGALFFTFQIYGDFSGYSDMAIGISRLFGIDLMRNFAYPYFSRDIAEFWRRWHISLNTWFRDYLYIPLGGSRQSKFITVRNIFIVFIVCGFWHGANWTFIIWGVLNSIWFLPLLLLNKNRHHLEIVAHGRYLPSLRELFKMVITFGITVFTWIFFRGKNLNHTIDYIKQMFSGIFEHPGTVFLPSFWEPYLTIIILLVLFLLIEWIGREDQYAIEKLGVKWAKPIRLTMYYIIILAILFFPGPIEKFIYFQF